MSIAPPLVLKKLHREVLEKVVGEIPKTLTNHAALHIEQFLVAAQYIAAFRFGRVSPIVRFLAQSGDKSASCGLR